VGQRRRSHRNGPFRHQHGHRIHATLDTERRADRAHHDALVPIRRASNGELVFYRFNPPRSWLLTNRFMF
jgi:hypothetical protein